jgi:Alkylmercury lyase
VITCQGIAAWNHQGMDQADLDLRNLTYRLFVELGRGPTADEVSEAAGSTPQAVQAGWRRLHEAHALVLDARKSSIRMANPFSAVPTAYRVFAKDRWWYANCAWDAFGICAALHVDGRIETSCPDCGQDIVIEVRDERPSEERLLFHCLVPAERWWDDIVFT